MSLQIYNSLSNEIEPFYSVEPQKVTMYVCGMTVYSDAHIGHARTYCAFDVIRRYFEYKGYKVVYVQNITDVDDKIIAASEEKHIDPLEYSAKYAERCLADLDALGIRRADRYPKASETIGDMIAMIHDIIKNGYAYEADGDVYFSVEKFKEYGHLSGIQIDELMSGARIEVENKKRNPLDFALWKQAKKGEPFWESPWGKGRPGWHIECSAMSSKFLGLPFDIHGGGMDLRFPHHENEIAQAQAATGKEFAHFWMHCGLLTIEGEKMSKSLGNIINIKDLIKEWDPEVIRFFFAQTHYRKPPDFSRNALKNAEKALDRLHRFKERLESLIKTDDVSTDSASHSTDDFSQLTKHLQKEFEAAMDDDFNTPEAIAAIFSFVNKANKYIEDHPNPGNRIISQALETLKKVCDVLTLLQETQTTSDSDKTLFKEVQVIYKKYASGDNNLQTVDAILSELLLLRQQARDKKDWGKADSIREDIESLGFEIQDTANGPIYRKRS